MQERTVDSARAGAGRGCLGALPLIALVLQGCAPTSQQAVVTDPGPAQPALETVPYQEILAPVPIRVRFPVRYGVEDVILYYRTFGERTWNALRLLRSGQTWHGAIGFANALATPNGSMNLVSTTCRNSDNACVRSWYICRMVCRIMRALK